MNEVLLWKFPGGAEESHENFQLGSPLSRQIFELTASLIGSIASCLLHSHFLLGVFFNPEDEGDIFY
jgi:hypothetical protein